MKNDISSAVSIDEIHNGAFSELANSAYNEGYDLTITEDMQMTLVARSLDKKAAPTITIKTVNTDGVYTFQATVSFPTLTYKELAILMISNTILKSGVTLLTSLLS